MERKDFITSFFKSPSLKKEVVQKNNGTGSDGILSTILPIAGSINPYTGPWTDNEAAHLLKRTMFGAPVENVNYFKTLSYGQAVDTLLNTTNSPAAMGLPVKVYATDPATVATDPDWSVPAGRTWVNTVTTSRDVNKDRRDSLKSWWLNIMVKQPSGIEEKMILFWSNHVTIEFQMVGNGLMCYQYLQLLRQHALGNFKTLIKQVTINPGMLIYLNGYMNNKNAPDENYGRELQELFTLGKGPDSQYTEDDVKAAARVLTGYQVDLAAGITSFNINRHDTNPKQFSSFYNDAIINRSAAEAQLETDDLVEMIFSKDEVSKNICRKLYRYFVYHDITPDTESAIITPLAETFRNNNYEIKPVLEQLFKSEHFFDAFQFGAMIKSPVDFTVGLIRECAVKLPPISNPQLLYRHLSYLATTFLPSVEESIGDPNNVAGYPANYQTPFFDKLWINTDTFIKRQAFIDTLVNSGGYSNGGFKTIIDVVAVAKRMSDPGNPNTLVLDLNKCFLRRVLSQGLRDTLKTEILLTGQANDYYWTTAWNDYINNPANLNNYSVVNTRLKSLAMYFLSKLEENQLM
jgi:uncharacterized protein (DUF1800 family)